MQFFQVIIGRYLVELIGASIRFSFNYLKSKITGSEYLKFSEYWNKKKGGLYEKLETETANRIAGGLFLFAIILIIVTLTV